MRLGVSLGLSLHLSLDVSPGLRAAIDRIGQNRQGGCRGGVGAGMVQGRGGGGGDVDVDDAAVMMMMTMMCYVTMGREDRRGGLRRHYGGSRSWIFLFLSPRPHRDIVVLVLDSDSDDVRLVFDRDRGLRGGDGGRGPSRCVVVSVVYVADMMMNMMMRKMMMMLLLLLLLLMVMMMIG